MHRTGGGLSGVVRPVTSLCVIAGLAFAASSALAQWPNGSVVTQTVHNLSRTAQVDPMRNFISNYREACVYCHSPHGGRTERPLWNRVLPNGPYRMYDPSGLSMVLDAQPTGTSRLCLSCHDGTIALDDVINQPLTHTGPRAPGGSIKRCATECHKGGDPEGGFNWEKVWFQQDFTKQHPFSIQYDAARNANFQPAAAVEAAGLKLEDGRVQCNTCHDPHTQQNRKFLRIPNRAGSLCLVCHRTPPSRSTAHFW